MVSSRNELEQPFSVRSLLDISGPHLSDKTLARWALFKNVEV